MSSTTEHTMELEQPDLKISKNAGHGLPRRRLVFGFCALLLIVGATVIGAR